MATVTPVRDLIKSSYYLSLIKDPGEDIEGFEYSIGLEALNAIIDQWSGLSIYIPTYTTLEIDLEPDVFEYVITPPITRLVEANLLDEQNVLTILTQIFLKRQNTINYTLGMQAPTKPATIFIDNDKTNMEANQSTVIFFPIPAQPYVATLRVMQMLTPFLIEDDIIEIPPRSIKALRYQLSSDLMNEFGAEMTPGFAKEYNKLMKELKAANKKDVSVQNRNPFNQRYRRFRAWNTFTG